jgi:hypothetical protein
MDEWLTQARDALTEVTGIAASELELSDETVATLLDLAGLAAHESGARTNAPLLCYLLGRAERGANLDTLATAIRELG